MEINVFQSLKGLAAEKDEFTQTLVNLVYGLAIEVNKLKRDLDKLHKHLEKKS